MGSEMCIRDRFGDGLSGHHDEQAGEQLRPRALKARFGALSRVWLLWVLAYETGRVIKDGGGFSRFGVVKRTRGEALSVTRNDAADHALGFIRRFQRDYEHSIRHSPVRSVEMLDFAWNAGWRSLDQALSHPGGFQAGRLHHYRVVSEQPRYRGRSFLKGWLNRVRRLRSHMRSYLET